MYLVVIKII